MITDPRCFFGRERELENVLSRLRGPQPTCVNVVGERRVGRSSLLWRIKQLADNEVQYGYTLRLVYMDCQSSAGRTPEAFWGYALSKLGFENATSGGKLKPVTEYVLEQALARLKELRLRPVLLLDEFERLVVSGSAFDTGFFNGMRSCLNATDVTFVIATQKPLSEMELAHPELSTLHGPFYKAPLGDLEDGAARALLGQANDDWQLSPDDVQFGLQLAGRHPLCLNIVGDTIYRKLEAHHGRLNPDDLHTVGGEYGSQRDYVFSGRLESPSLARRAIRTLGKITSKIWKLIGPLLDWIEKHQTISKAIGVVILALVLLGAGIVTSQQVQDFARKQIIGEPVATQSPAKSPTITPTP